MKKLKKAGLVALITIFCGTSVGCTESERVSYNISQEADNFNVIRRLTVLNARSDKPMFELMAAFSLTVDNKDKQLEITCEVGEGKYKKHFIGLNEYTMYVVEDVSEADVDKYRYEVNFLPESIVPVTFTNKD